MGIPRRLRRAVGALTSDRGPKAPPLEVPVEAPGEEGGPGIFVLGCQRSGTSLVRRILDSHPRIACPPETAFIGPLAAVLHDERARRGFEGMGYDPETVTRSVAAFITSFFVEYAAAQGKPRWADKTPHHVDILDDLWALFGPRARFIAVVRDGRDVAFSLSERTYPAIAASVKEAGGDVPVGAARFWARQTAAISDFVQAHPEACHEVRYEALTTDPAATLEPMFAFLGEPWEPSVIAYANVPHHSGVEDPDVAKRARPEPNSGKHRTWPEDTQRRVREACEPLLSTLGYR